MDGVARVVLAVASPQLATEVVDFLDRTGRARVVATASDRGELVQAVRRSGAEAVVAEPSLVPPPGSLNGSVLLAVDTNESVRSLRRALDAGARGFFLWPAERGELAAAAARAAGERRREPTTRGRTIAVYGPRGGVGTTFVATHLAAALARLSHRTLLVDLDPLFGDLSGALGAPEDAGPEEDRQSFRTLGDLVPVVRELAAEHVEGAAWSHPAGFGVLLAPVPPTAAHGIDARMCRAVVRAGADACEALVLHLARGLEEPTLAALEGADVVLVVLSLDVMAFRDARRALEVLRASGLDGRCLFVVNRAQRAEVRPADVRQVFGRPPVAVIRANRRVRAMQDRGRLLPIRGGTGRAVLRLARRVMEEDAVDHA